MYLVVQLTAAHAARQHVLLVLMDTDLIIISVSNAKMPLNVKNAQLISQFALYVQQDSIILVLNVNLVLIIAKHAQAQINV